MICLYEIGDEYDNNGNMITCFILPTKCEFQKPESYFIKIINEFYVGLNKMI